MNRTDRLLAIVLELQGHEAEGILENHPIRDVSR